MVLRFFYLMKSRRCLKFGLSKSIIEMDNSLLITLICVCGGGLMIILCTINKKKLKNFSYSLLYSSSLVVVVIVVAIFQIQIIHRQSK